MEESLKQLLLKDLSARLPYKVKCNAYNRIGTLTGVNDYGAEIDYGNGEDTTCEIQYCLPYLRPISSMTEEEFNSLKEETALNYNNQLDLVDWNNGCKTLEFWLKEIPSYVAILVFDWLNSHHFDYRASIDRGLALEAPEGIYK